jgi:hypothetical protein
MISPETPVSTMRWIEKYMSRRTMLDCCLFSTSADCECSAVKAWESFLNQHPDIFMETEPGKQRKFDEVVHYLNPTDRFVLRTPHGMVHIEAIRFVADLWVERSEIPISDFSTYSRTLEDKTIAQTVAIPFGMGDKSFECRFHNFGQAEKTLVRICELQTKAPAGEGEEKEQ